MGYANNSRQASGRIGGHFAEALLQTGKHTVTVITRANSKGKVPEGAKIARVNYDDGGESLVSALKGQQFLVITLGAMASDEIHTKIVHAAAKAGVPYIMPNAYGADVRNKKLEEENLYGAAVAKRLEEVEKAGATYVCMVCGFWYEWSLALGEACFGFDIKNRTVTFYDDGKTITNISTWKQCGRALAGLLSLPESGASPSVSDWSNQPLYIASFRITQRDMLDSLHRVLGTTDKDWTVTYEPSAKRYKDGLADMQKGERTGFAKAMYARVFYPNGDADYESSRGLANQKLGLPKDDLDEATKRTVDMVNSGWNPFAG